MREKGLFCFFPVHTPFFPCFCSIAANECMTNKPLFLPSIFLCYSCAIYQSAEYGCRRGEVK
jgi:hypothetical protein